jgi:hypothetical protein
VASKLLLLSFAWPAVFKRKLVLNLERWWLIKTWRKLGGKCRSVPSSYVLGGPPKLS